MQVSIGLDFFDIVRLVVLWVSPAILLEGLLLLLLSLDEYKKIEERFSKLGRIKRKRVPKIEANIYTFHNWLLKRKLIVGLICIICSVIFFLVLKNK